MSEVAIRQETQVAAPSETTAIISMIERAARDPAVDIEKMERLFAMQERAMLRQARVAYAEALAAMQPELPVIDRKGKIIIKDKGGDKVIQSTPYALWEDTNEAIKPVLARHGFSLSFKVGMAPDGKITVTGILMHREGHEEETTITLPHDSTGSKNAVQAVGSSTSYGKRYTAGLLLNLTSRGEDDDANCASSTADVDTISEEQQMVLRELIEAAEADEPGLKVYFKIRHLKDLRADKFDQAKTMLQRKIQKKGRL